MAHLQSFATLRGWLRMTRQSRCAAVPASLPWQRGSRSPGCCPPPRRPGWRAPSLLIVTAILVFLIGFFRYRSALRRLAREGVHGTSIQLVGALTLALTSGAVLALLLLFVE